MNISHADLIRTIKNELYKICSTELLEDNQIELKTLHELIHDSLDLLDFCMQIENTTGLEIKIDQLNNGLTIVDLASMLLSQVNNQSR